MNKRTFKRFYQELMTLSTTRWKGIKFTRSKEKQQGSDHAFIKIVAKDEALLEIKSWLHEWLPTFGIQNIGEDDDGTTNMAAMSRDGFMRMKISEPQNHAIHLMALYTSIEDM